MSIKTRGVIFITFFLNCIVIGLLVASLTTDHWIHSSPKRYNSENAQGHVHFGLFAGQKFLSVGIGIRPHLLDVPAFIRTEPDVINYWLWLGAALGTGFGVISSAVAAVASVLKSASYSKKHGTVVLLFISNFASAVSQLIAFICWMIQFYQYLTHNVLAAVDVNNSWYSAGLSSLGYSFYFVVVGIILVTINLILLFTAIHFERKERRRHIEPSYDEKTVGAIMLY